MKQVSIDVRQQNISTTNFSIFEKKCSGNQCSPSTFKRTKQSRKGKRQLNNKLNLSCKHHGVLGGFVGRQRCALDVRRALGVGAVVAPTPLRQLCKETVRQRAARLRQLLRSLRALSQFALLFRFAIGGLRAGALRHTQCSTVAARQSTASQRKAKKQA